MKLDLRSKVFLLSVGLITFSAIAANVSFAAVLDAGLAERVRADVFVRLPFIASAIALVAAVAMPALASHWMSKIRRSSTAARRMAAGHDELAELGRALQGLAGNLEGALKSLKEERVLMERSLEEMRESILLLDRTAWGPRGAPGSGWRS